MKFAYAFVAGLVRVSQVTPLAACAALVALSAAAGCKPRVGNESQYWDNHKKASAELSLKYPGFKSLLTARQDKATPLWEAAGKISNEEEKAKEMKAVNAGHWDGLPSRLEECSYKLEALDAEIGKISGLKILKSRADEQSRALSRARGVRSEVESALGAARPTSEAEAGGLLSDQIGKLISAQSDAERARKSLNAK